MYIFIYIYIYMYIYIYIYMYVCAHVTVNFLDKDKALSPDSWPDGIAVRQWRQRRTNRNLGWGNDDV